LFNILVLVSRMSNSFQGPFLAKRIERQLAQGVSHSLLADFRWLLISASCATLVGAVLIPTFQRLFSRAVLHFQIHRSIPQLLLQGLSREGLVQIKDAVSLPTAAHLAQLHPRHVISPVVVALNMVAVAFWTVGVFATLYAGYKY